jgi:signal transduction histidine kinase
VDATERGPAGPADRAERAGAAVLVSVQHELRTPLTVLQVTNETLAGLVDDPAVAGLLHAQQRALAKLQTLVEDILDVTTLVAEGSRQDVQSFVDVAEEVAAVGVELTDAGVDVGCACVGVRVRTVAPLFRLLLKCVVQDQSAFGMGAPVEVGGDVADGELHLWVRSTEPKRHLIDDPVTYSPHGGNGLNVLAATFLAERLGGTVEVPTVERDELLIHLPQRRQADRDD